MMDCLEVRDCNDTQKLSCLFNSILLFPSDLFKCLLSKTFVILMLIIKYIMNDLCIITSVVVSETNKKKKMEKLCHNIRSINVHDK